MLPFSFQTKIIQVIISDVIYEFYSVYLPSAQKNLHFNPNPFEDPEVSAIKRACPLATKRMAFMLTLILYFNVYVCGQKVHIKCATTHQ